MPRILLARFHSLGDVILTTGIVRSLIAKKLAVDVATSASLRPVFEGISVGRILCREEIDEAGLYDQVIDLQANRSSRRLLSSHGPIRRMRSRSVRRRVLVCWGRRRVDWSIPHAVVRYAEAAKLAAAEPEDLRPRVEVTDRDRTEGRRLVGAWESTRSDCIALATGASRRMKRWPEDRFVALGSALARDGLASLRFTEPQGEARERPGLVSAPLPALKGLLSRCKALVTNDSGVMHLGVGLGIPVVAIFGSTTLEFGFSPLGSKDRVVERDLACRPCAVHGARFCWQGHRRCLDEITVEEVRALVLAVCGRREG